MAYAKPHKGAYGSRILPKSHQSRSALASIGSNFKTQVGSSKGIPPDTAQIYGGIASNALNASMSPLSANIMQIDQSQLSIGQVKSVRGQIQRDCSLLRNRVRMLQSEMSKANKKIRETSHKTEEIRKIKEQNDLRYLKKTEK